MDRHTADPTDTEARAARLTVTYFGYAALVGLLAIGFAIGFTLAEPSQPLHDLMLAVSR